MSVFKQSLRYMFLFLVSSAMAWTACAQYRGSIQGVVTDPQGAVVTGVKMTLTNLETNQALETVTDGSGIYNFNALPPSRFTA